MSYDRLEARFREIADVGHAAALLSWDSSVLMPVGGGESRAQAMATLAGISHEKLVAPEVGDWLDAAEDVASGDGLDDWQRANVREMRRVWRESAALPADLVRALTSAEQRCEQFWREARGRNDWDGARPLLEGLFALVREKAQVLAAAENTTPHAALVGLFQPGIAVGEIDRVFGELRERLPAMVDAAIGSQGAVIDFPSVPPVAEQEALARRFMGVLGFDFEHGRLDVSHHPFCGGVPDDVRMTTRYADDGFLDAQMAVLHETGHALYEQGLPPAWRGQPVGDAAGMAVHESQSLTIEMQVARSRRFLEWAAPEIEAAFTGSRSGSGAFSAENLFRQATRVERSFIRVEADELTYPLHVVLRHELEKQLVEGRLAVADLPDAWDASMRDLLGLSTGTDHGAGCMQDVHWYAGLVGYFPSYTLGAIMAAQFFDAARAAIPGLEDHVGRGEIAPLRDWLRREIHGRGSLLTMQDLLRAVTGAPLELGPYLAHLQRRYVDRAA